MRDSRASDCMQLLGHFNLTKLEFNAFPINFKSQSMERKLFNLKETWMSRLWENTLKSNPDCAVAFSALYLLLNYPPIPLDYSCRNLYMGAVNDECDNIGVIKVFCEFESSNII